MVTLVPKVLTSPFLHFDYQKSDANYNYMNNTSNLRSLGMVKAAMPRVIDLYNKVNNLQNLTDVPILDRPLNSIRRNVGNEAVVDFESLRNAILTEVNTALSGSSVASDFRINLELQNMGSNRTVGQLQKAIGNLMSALEARGEASEAVPYPWDVVQGKKSMAEWKKEQREESMAAMKPANQPAGKTVVERRKSASGKILVKYSDGTIGEE